MTTFSSMARDDIAMACMPGLRDAIMPYLRGAAPDAVQFLEATEQAEGMLAALDELLSTDTQVRLLSQMHCLLHVLD